MIITPNPTFFTKATLKTTTRWPDKGYPQTVINGQALVIEAYGNKYPGAASSPRVQNWGNAMFETEHVIIALSGSNVTRSNFTLPANSYWVGSTGLTWRNKNISVGEVGWPPIPPPYPVPVGPNGETSPLTPGRPTTPDNNNNPNATVMSEATLICRNTSATPIYFRVTTRFVIPRFNNQTVNWYYTAAQTSPSITLRNAPPVVVCPFGFPTVSFATKLTFPIKQRPNTITRRDTRPIYPPGTIIPFVYIPPTNRFTLELINGLNIPAGQKVYFRIIPVQGIITADDLSGIPWTDKRTLTWTETTTNNGAFVSRNIFGAGKARITERFKIEIIYYPPTVNAGSCVYKYPPIKTETPVITLAADLKMPVLPQPIRPWFPTTPPPYWSGPYVPPRIRWPRGGGFMAVAAG